MGQTINFCRKTFSSIAIQRAAYDLAEAHGCQITQTDMEIVVTVADEKQINDTSFRAAVLDHELRIKLRKSIWLP